MNVGGRLAAVHHDPAEHPVFAAVEQRRVVGAERDGVERAASRRRLAHGCGGRIEIPPAKLAVLADRGDEPTVGRKADVVDLVVGLKLHDASLARLLPHHPQPPVRAARDDRAAVRRDGQAVEIASLGWRARGGRGPHENLSLAVESPPEPPGPERVGEFRVDRPGLLDLLEGAGDVGGTE
jgi:hypothetical protein